jgi:hypothetical protein
MSRRSPDGQYVTNAARTRSARRSPPETAGTENPDSGAIRPGAKTNATTRTAPSMVNLFIVDLEDR